MISDNHSAYVIYKGVGQGLIRLITTKRCRQRQRALFTQKNQGPMPSSRLFTLNNYDSGTSDALFSPFDKHG